MKTQLLLGLVIAVSAFYLITLNQQSKNDAFSQWKSDHSVSFQSQIEQVYRRKIFEKNVEAINIFNSEESNLYKQGVNQFTIYTQQQFILKFLNVQSNHQSLKVEKKCMNQEYKAVQIDWVEKGAVGPIKSQGMCGTANIFATVGGVEGFSKIKTGVLQSFSDQQLIDCVYGCTGSFANNGYDYYKNNSVCTTEQYPYIGRHRTCNKKLCQFKITDYKLISTCTELQNAIMKQPITVAVDAIKWQTYSSGILSNCGTNININHMTVLVGMADQYWKCKNSWGASWGQKGYIRLARGNTCGICQYGIYPA